MSLIEKIALKPCPFCGGEAHMRGCLLDERFGYAGVHEITCDDCEASIKRIDKQRHGDYPEPTSKPEAIAAWNNRAALTAIMDAGDGAQEDAEFTKAVWGALKGDHNDLRREAIILRAHREALARHRSTAAAAERARIVAWLRGQSDALDTSGKTGIGTLSKAVRGGGSLALHKAAGAIERGEV